MLGRGAAYHSVVRKIEEKLMLVEVVECWCRWRKRGGILKEKRRNAGRIF